MSKLRNRSTGLVRWHKEILNIIYGQGHNYVTECITETSKLSIHLCGIDR